MKIFLLLDATNESAKGCANEVVRLIKKDGFQPVFGEGSNEKKDLTDARFLIFIAESAADFSNPTLTAKWRFFINEVRWKRKTCGDIILICSDACDFSRIPFTLRESNILKKNEVNELNKLILSFAGGNTPTHLSYENRIRNGSLKVEPVRSTSLNTSVSVPTNSSSSKKLTSTADKTPIIDTDALAVTQAVENLAETIKAVSSQKADYKDNGCKKDHVFERKEFKRSSIFSNKTQKQQVEQSASGHKHGSGQENAQSRYAQGQNTLNETKTVQPTELNQRSNAISQKQSVSQKASVPNKKPNTTGQNDSSKASKADGNKNQVTPQSQRPTPYSRPPASRTQIQQTQQNRQGQSNQNNNKTDDYDPFTPPPKKPIKSQNAIGCVIGFFAAFFFTAIVILSILF